MRVSNPLSSAVLLLVASALAAPALASLSEDFDDPGHASQWTTWHEADFHPAVDIPGSPHEDVLQLTNGQQALSGVGQAWYSAKLPARQFVADFQFTIFSGYGGYNFPVEWPAGLTFGWVSDINEAWGQNMGAFDNDHVNNTWVYGYPGHFVAFNSNEQERSHHGTVFGAESQATSLTIPAYNTDIVWESAHWYDARVRLDPVGTDARVRVWVEADGNGQVDQALAPMLDYLIPDYTTDEAYFGFTAGASWVDSYHRVDNFRLSSAPSVPEPASCALLPLAMGGIGAMLKKRRKR
jgi:hypothetical protein